MDMNPLYLLTAPSGAGKTTFCAALAEQARAAGWDVAGILSLPIFENNEKVGIRAQNLRTGETRPLAQLAPSPIGRGVGGEGLPSPIGRGVGGEGLPSPIGRGVGGDGLPSPIGRGAGGEGLPLGRWLFSPSALAWGNDILAACLPADLFIVDELGPLELIRGAGWTNALQALRSQRYRAGIAVIRPELIETAQKIFPGSQALPLPRSASEFFSRCKETTRL